MNDLSNEELQEMWLECGKDIFKYGRLVMAWTERREMHKGIVPATAETYCGYPVVVA
jgi:hypothetical protein